MSKLVEQSTANLRTLIIEAIGKAITAGQLPSEPIPDFTIEVPADRSHGDWATNVAMVSAKAFKLAPRKIAEAVASHIVLDNSYFKSCEIAGPGFLNFFLNEQFYVDVVKEVTFRFCSRAGLLFFDTPSCVQPYIQSIFILKTI